MNKFITNLFLSGVMVLFCSNAGMAQALTGNKTIPGNYASLANAISDLNANGVGAGGVTFLIAAGYTELVPSGGFLLNASGTATAPVVFLKSGTGSNPLLYASPGTTANADGMFILSGCDYVTIDGIDLADTNSVSNPNQMEWGYALVRASATNAPQYVTIQNCTITLNRQNTSSVGIYSGCHLATSITPLTITSPAGAVSFCKLYKNTISNAYIGISLSGYNDPASPYSLYDQSNQVGADAKGNTITGFGGAGVAARGIYTTLQNNLLVSNNRVVGGTGSSGTVHGIYVGSASASQTIIRKNNIQDTSSTTASGSHLYGIQSDAGTGSGGKVIIDSNRVNFCYFTSSTVSSTFYGILYTGGADSILVYANHIDSNRINGTGSFYAIQQTSGASNVNSRVYRNQIYANIKLATGSGAMYLMDFNLNATISVFENAMFNDTSNAIGFFYGIRSQTSTLGEERYYANNISYMVGTGTGALYAIYSLPSFNTGVKSLYDNQIWGLRSASGNTCYGLYAGNGIEMNIYRNKVYDFLAANSTANFSPFYLAGNNGTTINAYNNYVYDIRLPFTSSASAIRGIQVASGLVNVNMYHNTVYLNSASSAAATTACLYLTVGGIGIQDIRNNIFVNNSTQVGAGRTIAYQRSGNTLNTHAATSDGNLYYAGTPGANRLIFYDGFTGDSTMLQFKTRMINREKLAVSENVLFVNTTTQPYDMHVDPVAPTQCESGGISNTLVTADYYGAPRNVNRPDIGAEEKNFVAAELLAPVIDYKQPVDTTIFANRIIRGVTITDVSNVDTVAGKKPRLYYKKFAEANTVAGNTAIDNGWKYVEAGNNTSPFTFTLNPALLTSGISVGDIIQYFVVAQDKVTVPNVGIRGALFAAAPASVALTAAAFPVTGVDSFNVKAGFSGTFTVGTGSPQYPTLTLAVADLNNKVLTGPVQFLLLDANYTATTETFPLSINANGGSSATNTVTIKPQTGITTTIGDNVNGSVLILNGIDYLTIDGKQNNTSIRKQLFIDNTNTSAGAAAITFINDASNNKLVDLTVRGSNAPTNGNGGVIVFSTGLITGNDFNRIDSCDITTASATSLPSTLIYALGTNSILERYNDQNVITNCRLYDYWNAASEFNALKMGLGNNTWTITQNHIYQTAARSTSATHTAFNFIPNGDYTSLNGMNISNNFIGGSDVFCGGAPWTQLTSTGAFTNVFNMGASSFSRFSRNTFTNFLCNTSNTSTFAPGAWNAVQWANGLMNIDSNTFGSTTDTSAIVLNSTSTTSGTGMNVMIISNFASIGTFSISGNTFGGIKVSSAINLSVNLNIINVSSSGGTFQTFNIQNNVIGNKMPGNILATNSTSTTAQSVAGILFSATSSFNLNVKNNTIRNLTNQYGSSGSGYTHGITFSSSPTGVHTISNNTISDLINYSSQTNGVPTVNGNISVMGIQLVTTATGSSCTGNKIYNLTNTNTFAVNTCVAGIGIRNTTDAVISANHIYALATASTSTGLPGAGSAIYGIAIGSGSCRVTNNMISVGRDSLGNAITSTPTIAGVYKASTGALGCYFNTIKVSGTGVGTGLGASYAIRRATSGVDTIMNNILENSRANGTTGGAHYAFHATNGNTLVSDYNLFHSDLPSLGDTLVSVGGTPYLTIPLWTTASTSDAHSKDTLVDFVNSSNLHLATTMYGKMTFKGVPVNGITTDFDAQNRTSAPYIGADEIPASPLPVEWMQTTATVVNHDVALDWAVASEINNSGFIIERSADGKNFTSVSFVKSAGNSSSIYQYKLVDQDPFKKEGADVLYYRIKQVDANGDYSYSDIMPVALKQEAAVAYTAYPNPFNDAITVDLQAINLSGKVEVKLLDLTGRTILSTTQTVSGSKLLVQMPDLQAGLYLLNITHNGHSQSVKVSKQ
jgi:hypothetical protein